MGINDRICRRCNLLYIILFSGFLCFFNLCFGYLDSTVSQIIVEPQIISWKNVRSDLQCHYSTIDDGLVSFEDVDFLKSDNAIFFHETSCRGGITSRQACAIESAAKIHPKWQINVLFSSPVTEHIILTSNLVKLLEYGNVQLARLKIDLYGKGTLVEDILTNQLKKSTHPIEHAADILRMLTLHKYGGIYLDTDTLLIRSLEDLPPNWIGKEATQYVASGAMGFAKDEYGTNWTTAILTELRDTFNPKSWSHNGPLAIQRVLDRRCPNHTDCEGLKVYPPKYFYPVYYTRHKVYFENGTIPKTDEAYMHHMWNFMNKDKKVEIDSPYAKLAKQFCPKIYEMYGDNFGE